MRPAGRRGAAPLAGRLLLLVLLLCGFGAAPARAGWISQGQEVEIGRQGAARLEARYPLDTERGRVERVHRLAPYIAARSARDLAWRFRILDLPDVNALAFPGGFIYVTRGLMEAMPDGALAFVLAHEIAHVDRRHSVQQLEADLIRRLGLAAALELFGRARSSPRLRGTARLVDAVLASQYSQAHEHEADRVGIQLMAAASFDPQGAVEALEILRRLNPRGMPGFLNALLGTHPLPEDRIRRARELAASTPVAPPPASRP